ncbi:MAG: D-cysteine desulfhydrase family protein [Anaerolineales bacterium]|nr:D-cysteine desulfhydrase family protein [Anaerolineales bacterium]
MKQLPRLRFAHLPTPVEHLPRLSADLQGPRLLIKRDDQTGLALGGNKARKLEFLVAEAQANGARALITTGAIQSNHCRQTAAAARRFGLDCILVLVGTQPAQPTANLLLDQLLGAEIVWTDHPHRDDILKATFDQAWADGRRPYLVPYGGSSPTGAAAYAFAIQELLDQGVRPDWILFASSSGGTQAGMVLGARLFGYQGKLLGISVDEKSNILQARVSELATATADRLGETLNFTPDEILTNDGFLGGGYGVMGQPEREAIQLFAKSEAILLDPVYTGRAAAGLISLIHQGFFPSEQTVLFWHTGGTPALFADRYTNVIQGT